MDSSLTVVKRDSRCMSDVRLVRLDVMSACELVRRDDEQCSNVPESSMLVSQRELAAAA